MIFRIHLSDLHSDLRLCPSLHLVMKRKGPPKGSDVAMQERPNFLLVDGRRTLNEQNLNTLRMAPAFATDIHMWFDHCSVPGKSIFILIVS